MYEPAAIWSMNRIVFDREISSTQNVILSQGASALISTIRHIDRLRQLTVVSPEMAPTLSDICYQAGLASTILFNDSPKGSKESQIAYAIRIERKQYVFALCAAQNLSILTLKDRDVRNALTHIDERLGQILTKEPNVGWYIDSAIHSRNQFDTPAGIAIKYCRCYLMDEGKILHLGHELDVIDLRRQCVVVLAAVFGKLV
jgi:hypothetical protein